MLIYLKTQKQKKHCKFEELFRPCIIISHQILKLYNVKNLNIVCGDNCFREITANSNLII